ncbi:AraC family transcriptional regulator [Mucilaginibacter sp. JC4]|uniref:AraC family transcriptional regulator n=2 Tax=Mucilaginibacter aquariorum TaxID=2967225 RepID=A0ABT1SWC8_9SPHI|nr:AraC family transcriptional regulator [Mucilaginibacter aquariorum]
MIFIWLTMINYRKYLNVNDQDRKWDFYINTIGSASVSPNKDYPNNRAHPVDHILTWDKGRILNGYYIVFISRGEGVLETARTESATIKAGTCFFLFPGIWHRYKPNARSGWEEYWVGFNGNFPTGLVNSGILNPDNPFVEVGLNEDLLSLFHLLIKTVSSVEPGYQQIATGITLQMLGIINAASKYRSLSITSESRLMSKAKFMLQETIDRPVNMEEFVRELPMGYSKFRKLFKSKCGISPNQYHLNLRLDKAKEMMITTNLSVNEIADQTGFDSIFYFSRVFKKKTGLSPRNFREDQSSVSSAN